MANKKIAYLYGLLDPSTNQLRYIGQTLQPVVRYKQHLLCKENCKKDTWISSLNTTPKMIVFDKVDALIAGDCEKAVINFLVSKGFSLLNCKVIKFTDNTYTKRSIRRCTKSMFNNFSGFQKEGVIIAPWLNTEEALTSKMFRIQVYLSEETKLAIKQLADTDCRSESFIVGKLLDEGVKNYELS